MNPKTSLLTAACLLALAAPASSADPLDGAIDAACGFRVDSAAGNAVLVTLSGHAVAPATSGAAVAGTTALRCELLDEDGATVLDFEWSVNGPAVAAAESVPVDNPGPLTVCTSAYAYYMPSGSRLDSARTCVTP